MQPVVRSWLGEDRPKQYCTFVGTRSMFEHTVDRARSIVPDDNIVSVIGPGHRKFLFGNEQEKVPGLVVEQPRVLGTAPGVFLPSAYVMAAEPGATILLLPSDHFVYPEERFCHHLTRACELVESCPDRLVILGAIPDRPETDYGWIAPHGGGPIVSLTTSRQAKRVLHFREKPGLLEADALFREGCLWNTMIVAVKANTLWKLGQQYLPDLLNRLSAFRALLRAFRSRGLFLDAEGEVLARLYDDLKAADFSRDFLQRAADQMLVLPMEGVEWCDWGRPARVTETLGRLGRRPAFEAQRPPFVRFIHENLSSAKVPAQEVKT
jgi:mannose-1-phosphate guanylyltransferase